MTAGAIAALLANGGLNIASIYFLGRRPDDRRRITSWCFTLGLIAVAIAALLILLVGRWVAPDALGNGHGDLLVASASLAASVVAFEFSGSLLLGHDRRSAYLVTQGIEGLGSLALVAAVFMLGLAPLPDMCSVGAGSPAGVRVRDGRHRETDRRIRLRSTCPSPARHWAWACEARPAMSSRC